MPQLKFWYAPGACSLATHIALHETGLPFTAINATAPLEGQLIYLPESFRDVNPKKRVPVLAIDDEVITEAPAILLAISTLKPELKLYGDSDVERIRIAEWLNWISGTLHSQGFGALFRPERYLQDESLHPKLKGNAVNTINGVYASIDEKLSGKDFAVGGHFTVVDAFLFPFWRWGKMSGFKMEENYPNYTKLVTRVRERQSAKKALATEGVESKEYGFADSKM